MATSIQREVVLGIEVNGTPVVEVEGLSRVFDGNVVIDQLNLEIPPGQFIALLGTSGCGKSTLLRILAGLDSQIEGKVTVATARSVAFQSPRLMPWKRLWRNIILGREGADKTTAMRSLEEVGLTHRALAWPKVLSGGEAQRASLARALVREPDLLLLDEPFSALDALTRIKMHELVLRLWRKHRCAVLLVTHDVDEALQLADRILVMKDGRIAHEFYIDTERPRDPAERAIRLQRNQILARLGVDAGDDYSSLDPHGPHNSTGSAL